MQEQIGVPSEKPKKLPRSVAMYLSDEQCEKCDGVGRRFDSAMVKRLLVSVMADRDMTYTAVAKYLEITPQILCDLIYPANAPRRKWTLGLVEKLVKLKNGK